MLEMDNLQLTMDNWGHDPKGLGSLCEWKSWLVSRF